MLWLLIITRVGNDESNMKPTFIALLALCLCVPLMGTDKAKALSKDFKSLKTLAEKGDAEAQFNLGQMYYEGLGVDQDYKEAVKWYQEAADKGHARAQFNLGVMYDYGEGVFEDSVTAYAWAECTAYGAGDEEKIGQGGIPEGFSGTKYPSI